jgi:tRNA (guanine37-N1)-methyltransferase
MLIRVFTSYPEYFKHTIETSILGSSKKSGFWSFEIVDIRDYGIGKHKKIDDTIYGGGCGLLMRADVLSMAIEDRIPDFKNKLIILTSPRGLTFKQNHAEYLSSVDEINIIANRFEGVDQRFIEHYNIKEVSIGNYVLFGGEVAILVMMEAIIRLIDGVIEDDGKSNESFGKYEVEHDHYTKPAIWKDLNVPEVLMLGNHANIEKWKNENAEMAKTKKEKIEDIDIDYFNIDNK